MRPYNRANPFVLACAVVAFGGAGLVLAKVMQHAIAVARSLDEQIAEIVR